MLDERKSQFLDDAPVKVANSRVDMQYKVDLMGVNKNVGYKTGWIGEAVWL